MKISPYQTPELRNESDVVIQVGTYGKYTPFANAENTGILDYINNNLEALKNALSGAYVYVKNKSVLPASGDVTKIYVTQDDGKSYKWTGTEWSLLTSQLNGLSAYEIAQSLGFTGTEEEWITSLGTDTISSATVDSEGYLTMHMKGGADIKTPLQPIIDCIKYRDSATLAEQNATSQANTATSAAKNATSQAQNASNSATSASNSAKASSVSEGNAKASADNAKTSEANAKASEVNAKTSETNASSSATMAKNWAVATESPDGAIDTDSDTGKTQSSRSWALASKGSAESASASAGVATTQASSATAGAKSAGESATSASNSATSAASSATAAKNSATAAASSATSASTSTANSEASNQQSKKWAIATDSPDGTADTSSSTGKTQSSRSWALYSKDRALASETSAKASANSATSAATHEANAKQSLVASQNVQKEVEDGLKKVSSVVTYRGTVDTFSNLPTGLTTDNTGDMYNVKSAGGTDANGNEIKAGDNVVWNGNGWDDQSGHVDLSDYYTKEEMGKAVLSIVSNDDTLTFIHRDATRDSITVNNVDHATKATLDSNGKVITDTYETMEDAHNAHKSLQADIDSLSSKLGDGMTPITLWEGMHTYSSNYVPSDVSNAGWNKLGFCSIYYNTLVLNNQPTRYGQLINIPATKDGAESTQLWIDQNYGCIRCRGGNTNIPVNDTPFKLIGIGPDDHLHFPNGAELWVD